MKCIRCESERIRKDGQIRLGGQRWRQWEMLGLLLLVLTGCSPTNEFTQRFHRPIRIRTPKEAAVLRIGQSFHVVADITVDYPVAAVEVGLWGAEPNAWHTWWVADVGPGDTIRIDETFELPKKLPPGGEYRLSVRAVRDDTRGVATMDSLSVNVLP